jgi:serine/threonine protein kinase
MSQNKANEDSVLLSGSGENEAPEPSGDQGGEEAAAPAADAEDLMSLPTGTLLGDRYEVLGKLGSGGFGIVYEARDREASGDVFAIKEYVPDLCVRHLGSRTVSPRYARDKQAFEDGLKAFVEEARTLRELDNANIVRVFHWFKQHGTAYIVMRRLRGQTLECRIDNGERLEGEGALKLTRDLLSALHTVHDKGLLHRDISPSNVFVLEDGTPVLLDFGAARFAIGKVSQRLTAIARHGYTPREQYDEYGIEPQSPATDFYALGATLYHAVTLNKPISSVKRERERDMLRPAVEAGAGYLPEAALRAIDKALNIDSSERWQSAREWLASLDRSVKGGGGDERRPQWPYFFAVLALLFVYYFFFTGE